MLLSLALLLLLTLPAGAVSTKTWEQSRFEEFEKGDAGKIALASDGRIALAPRFEEIFDSPSAYLWTLARDSKGNLFAGGGPDGRVFKITPDGKKTRFFQTDAFEIHALAIDRHDNVYAATSPDSKIYKIEPSGKSALFVDPKVKYVWAMAFDSKGDLFLATGDQGEIYRVTPSGQARVFFKSDESHIRSLAIDKNDDLIAGTDPDGLVLRIHSSDAAGFVLRQASKAEITALALGPDGSIFAAEAGTPGRPSLPPAAAPAPVPAPAPTTGPALQTSSAVLQTAPPPAVTHPSLSGGSDVYRIGPDGAPRRLWTSGEDIVYSLGFDPSGRLLIGTGNRGRIYRLDSDNTYSLLVKAAPSQITAFLSGPGGRLYAATGNVGKVYQLGPELEKEGTFTSEVFDAGAFSYWGRLSWQGSVPAGASVEIFARSGNLSSTDEYWSPWSKSINKPEGAPIESPPARFVQWKAVMKAAGGAAPVLDSVSLAYEAKNVAPVITAIEITPPNYRFPDVTAPASSSQALSLPAIGAKPPARRPFPVPQNARSMTHSKGSLGARWSAQDENDDQLVYKVEIRGENEREWKPLREDLDEPQLSWDSTAFADGLYRLRVTASDSPSNPGGQALSYTLESEPFRIDNAPPVIAGLSAAAEAGKLRVRFHGADALSDIKNAEYSVDGDDWKVALPVTRLFDSLALDFDFLTGEEKPGEHTVAVRITDANDNLAVAKVVVK